MNAGAAGVGESSSQPLAVAPKCVLLAGGGSGGHISPGLAIAERMKAIDPACRPVFVCSQRPIDAQMLTEAGAEHVAIAAEPMSLRPRKLLRCIRSFMQGRAEVLRMIDQLQPSWVVSLGGFVTAPVVHAAQARRVPVLLMNLDATPGRANRWVARRAREVVSAVPTPTITGFAREIIGMPLRRLALAPAEQASCREQLGLLPGVRTLLVTGASQGANSLNDFMLLLAQREPVSFTDWQVLHLCGPSVSGGAARIEAGYRAAGVHAVVLPFLHRMGLAWGAADLALSRAGANSVGEAAANHVPTIFVPYPYHADLHQMHNAMPLVEQGAAALAKDAIEPEANLRALGEPTLRLMRDHAARHAMRARLQARSEPDAAERIARFLLGAGSFS
ncbi:MAG: UDP-N-acetylglucosamine--N-acetylmuramyl-(pentapeptide) pyrophosphoryl-undecaprenol N-acetylglucosamine transferase [Planctomycetes bacterium]|nr:UDP-N-acetylglucosamine--N-acetylmuramyl-(pentapeptide) pyrophosphoryl-undecaprenol N-acetylglucosamine transferase [Planctomycetota bacterium]